MAAFSHLLCLTVCNWKVNSLFYEFHNRLELTMACLQLSKTSSFPCKRAVYLFSLFDLIMNSQAARETAIWWLLKIMLMFIIITYKNQNRSPDVNVYIHGCSSHRPVLHIDGFLPQNMAFAGNFKQSVSPSVRLRRMFTQFTGTGVLSHLTPEISWSSGAGCWKKLNHSLQRF